MKCVILAAGYATRLYPLTAHFPKPLLPVAGKPILDHLLDDLDSTGLIDGYIIVTNHRYAAHFRDWAKGRDRVTLLDDGSTDNDNRLGAVRDLLFAIDALHLDEDLLVMAGDNLLDFSLARFLHYARDKGTSCIMRYREPDRQRLTRCGVAVVNASDRVLRMAEKPSRPESEWVCPPFYVLTQEAVRLVRTAVADGCGVDAPGSLIAWLCGRVPVHAMEMPGRRYDVGTIGSYEAVQRDWRGIPT